MIEKITDEELLFMETFYNPIAQAETLFSDYDNLGSFHEDESSHIRLGQFPLLSYEYLIDENPDLKEKENFLLRKGAGEIYCLGGRLFGKTLCVEKIDLLIAMLLNENERCGFSSYDAIHIRDPLEDVIQALENHPIFLIYKAKINRNPYRITLRNGFMLISVNMNITGKRPGSQFYQKHFSRLYIEEASFETEEVYKKRRDSVSEDGCIFRVSGMTNFTKHSPCGQIFYYLANKPWIANLPQYINPKWDNKAKDRALKDFGGEQSAGFRIYVKGEVVEDAISAFDMDRVRKCYLEEKRVKSFEINKENFFNFENIIVIERPSNAESCWIDADVGEDAPTEIIILFEINKKYRLVYNITAYGLTDKQQKKLFRWIAKQVKANFIGIDTTDQLGRAIYRDLAEIITQDHLCWVGFNEKITVDYEKDEEGNTIFKNGKPIPVEEYVINWSVKHLRDLLYDQRLEIPLNFKFDKQFNSILAKQLATKITYECALVDDHLFQAFQVFSISQWLKEFSLTQPVKKKTFSKVGAW